MEKRYLLTGHDSFQTAIPIGQIGANSVVAESGTLTTVPFKGVDPDFYSFTVPANSQFTVTTTVPNSSSQLNTHIYQFNIYQGTNNLIGFNVQGSGTVVGATKSGQANYTYYVQATVGIYSSGLTSFPYQISISTIPPLKASSVSLTSSQTSSYVGQPITLTATVSSGSFAGQVPTGSITFQDGATNIGTGTLNASGVAKLTTSALAAGMHSLTAIYGGDSSYKGSTSNSIAENISVLDDIEIAINDTPSKSDDITLFEPGIIADANAEELPAEIINEGNTTGTFQLSVNNPAEASITPNSVTLGSGKHTDVEVIPKSASTKIDDVHIIAKQSGYQVGESDMTIASISFGTIQGTINNHITNQDTPVGMSDRIPPAAPTPLFVSVSPDLTASGESISLAVGGQTNKNYGTATLNGSLSPITITGSQTVILQGIQQTAPADMSNPNNFTAPYAKKLYITASVHGVVQAQSLGFSVAAIPTTYTTSKLYDNGSTDPRPYGFTVHYQWQSDSGQIAAGGYLSDLMYVQEKEIINSYNRSGSFLYGTLDFQHDYDTSTSYSLSRDSHGFALPTYNGGQLYLSQGSSITDQLFVFEDARTGDQGIAISNTGFKITRQLTFNSITNIWVLTTIEIATPITIGKLTSKPGIIIDPQDGSMIVRNQNINKN